MLKLTKQSLLILKNIQKPTIEQFAKFTKVLNAFNNVLDGALSANESEEHIKKLIYDFLQNAYDYTLNTKNNIDAAIKNNTSDSLAVIFEAKRPQNVSEMITQDEPNRKAMHEAIYYFMQERNEKNDEIKRVVITNGYEWFIFDATDFEKLFWLDNKFKKRFLDFEGGTLTSKKTDHFYNNIAKHFLDTVIINHNLLIEDVQLQAIHFDIRTLQTENDKIAFFKALSKPYLLKEETRADPNHLNEPFYLKLLDIMGLEQVKNGSKKIIQRCNEQKRNSASLLENAIGILQREIGVSEDKLFDTALSLVIIWINRILFLKLLESTLLRYHKNNEKYRFLSFDKLKDYDALNSLFFEVLAISQDARSKDVAHFAHIPYLNSSLFETTELEKSTIRISNLKDGLVYKEGKNTLAFLFDFLDSYDFGAENEESIIQTHKTIISASVLGLVFEKINGYKDGSFYTPSFITMYMAKEAITKAVLQKFKTTKEWDCTNLVELYNKIKDANEANQIINSITICDPAVGSGHFLVSCLNEIIRIKAELGILCDEGGKRLKDYTFDIQNDELIVWDEDKKEEFTYAEPFASEASRVQKTLFNEKRQIIENQLFGVDINPNSVNICRLRLWIELLKNAYYEPDGKLDTLPNIDINIKCGNSLISRFDLKDELKINNIKVEIENYKKQVSEYKDSIGTKTTLLNTIKKLKDKFKLTLKAEGKLQTTLLEKLKLFVAEFGTESLNDNLALYALKNRFGHSKSLLDDSVDEKRKAKALKEIEAIEAQIKEIESGKIYENAFEWRFEFPEVLNEKGEFVGFDVVIGNPPYGVSLSANDKKYFTQYYESAKTENGLKGSTDTYSLFIDKGLQILNNGILNYIVPLAVTSSESMSKLHSMIFSSCEEVRISSYFDRPKKIFDDAEQAVAIIECFKNHKPTQKLLTTKINKRYAQTPAEEIINNLEFANALGYAKMGRIPKIGTKLEENILKKLFSLPKTLKDYYTQNGENVYYRTSGGRYYKVITNFPTGSSKENFIKVDNMYRDLIGAILSSNLYFWFYQVYSNTLDLKSYELEILPLNLEFFTAEQLDSIGQIYNNYMQDLESNARIVKANYAMIDSFKEYKARLSKHLIDELDRAIYQSFNLTQNECEFLINYDLKFRVDDE